MSRQTAAQIEREASQWLMRLDRDGRTPELIAELDAWLAGDRRRRGAWLQAEAAWLILDRIGEGDARSVIPAEAGISGQEVAAVYGSHEAQRLDPGLRRDDEEGNGLPIPNLLRRRLIVGGGAAIAASLAGGLFILSRPERIVTAVGEIRRVPLADGSTAAINTQSTVAIAIADDRRTVRIEQGEAWFQVRRDPARPFVVEAGRVRVQAVGTAFSVRRRANGADVLVTEGVVEAWADGAEGNRVRLAAGQRAFVADNAAISQAAQAPSEVDRTLAWRSGRIDLAGEPLRHAVQEFNRYNMRQIVIGDPHLADERFYGIFRTDDPEGFAMAVRSSLEVPVQTSATEIRIGR